MTNATATRRFTRKFTAPKDAERCTGTVTLRDGSGAACMHKRVKGSDRCRQHPLDAKPVARLVPVFDGSYNVVVNGAVAEWSLTLAKALAVSESHGWELR